MNENTLIGSAQDGLGKVETRLGETLGANNLKAAGAVDRAEGGARKVAGKAQAKLDAVSAKLTDKVSKAVDMTAETYDRAATRAREAARAVDPIVHERPYAVAGAAMAVGLLFGLLLAGRGSKVIYVKTHS